MSLLQPWLLYLAAGGAAILILAYYLRRRQAPRVEFSAVSFLPQASRARMARAALPPLRILLPLAILAAGATALAQPMLARTQPAPVAIIMDDSGFSGDRDIRQIGLALAAQAGPDSPWAVYATSGGLVASGSGRQHLLAVLESYQKDVGRAAYSPAVFNAASAYLKERSGSDPVLLLVGNRDTLTGYPGLKELRTELEKDGARLFCVATETAGRPVFIAATEMPPLAKLGASARARVGIANTGPEALTSEVTLSAGDRVLLKSPVRLQARSLTWQELATTPPSPGQASYAITVTAGAYQDQVGWDLAAFTAQKALVIAASGSPGYIEKALTASPLVEGVTIVQPQALDAAKLKGYLAATKLAVLDGVDSAAFPAALGTELRGWVEAGGTLIFMAGPSVNENWNKSTLGPLLPSAFKRRQAKVLQGTTVGEHAVVRGLEMAGSPLMVSRWQSVDTPALDSVLVRVGAEPMLLAKRVKQGNVFQWNSTGDPRWNNWAQHPSFPAFWSNLLVYAISGDVKSVASSTESGRALWRAAVNTPTEKVYYVNAAEGRPVSVPAELRSELERPASSFRDFHLPFLGLGLLLAVVYLGLVARRAR